MKHGDKAKSKAVKASGKKSGKTTSASKSSKVARDVKSKSESVAAKSKAGKEVQRGATAGGNGKNKPRANGDEGGFSNPLVAAAFKRAVKKYPNAFRRLTD